MADGFHSSIVKPRLIYLDTDVLLLQDIEVLWKTDMKGLPAAAVEDCSQTFEPRLHPIKLHGSLDGHCRLEICERLILQTTIQLH